MSVPLLVVVGIPRRSTSLALLSAGAVLAVVVLISASCAGVAPRTRPAAADPGTARLGVADGNAAAPPPQSGQDPQASAPKATPSASTTSKPPSRPALTDPGPGGSVRGTGSGSVALTFDDGPDPVNTPALLDLLAEHRVKATFCVVGSRARDHREVVARIAAEGHTLCNHSWQHLQNLSDRDDGYLRWDLKATNDAIRAAVPGAKIKYFRAPYGLFTPRVTAFAAELGMKPIYWDVDDECFRMNQYGTGPAMVNHITSQVQRGTRPGSMILSHEYKKPHTVTAYRSVLPWLKERFRLVALPA